MLETHARRTLGEVLTAKGEKGAYVYDVELRVRAALRILPRKTELTGANGGPLPINWISSVDPHALRKAKR